MERVVCRMRQRVLHSVQDQVESVWQVAGRDLCSCNMLLEDPGGG